jgi:hypothetical protein
MKGGNVIGEGAYGCVFDPALLCEGEKARPKGFITKCLIEIILIKNGKLSRTQMK